MIIRKIVQIKIIINYWTTQDKKGVRIFMISSNLANAINFVEAKYTSDGQS